MALDADGVRQAIVTKGYCALEDNTIGNMLDELVNSGFSIQTTSGMGLCKKAIFRNAVSIPDLLSNIAIDALELVRDVARTFFQRSTVGFFRKFGKTKNIHCVLPRTSELRILVVFVWSSGSKMTLQPPHPRDHGVIKAGNGLFTLANKAQEFPVIPGNEPTQVTMAHGGL